MKPHLCLSLLLASNVALATPADDLLDRIGGVGASRRIITAMAPHPSGAQGDYFTIAAEDGKPKITGNSYLSIATGIGWYLKYHAGICISWNQLTTDLVHAALPLPSATQTQRTRLKYRYYLNYCTHSYSMAFWSWERWQQELDWMALHGINMPLALTGTEVVWRNVLVNSYGYSKAEANDFVAGAAYQAWFLMNNLEGWGGVNPDEYYDRQEGLQKKIVARMRELGMMPVLAGYSGMAPHSAGNKLGWKISNSPKWCSFTRPEFINPTDPDFDTFAQRYYQELARLYGASPFYSADLFHEGNVPHGVDVAQSHAKVYEAMKRYSGAKNPQWLMQAWGGNPRQAALDVLDTGSLIVLDLFSDGSPRWSQSFAQSNGSAHEYIFCMLHNFGGRLGLHGRLAKTMDDFYTAQTQHPRSMQGIGATMEGIETNPMLYEALYELPWREVNPTAKSWLSHYPQLRYGKANSAAAEAWLLLERSVYSCPTDQQGTTESVLCARPQLDVKAVSTWSTTQLYHNPSDVLQAARLLLSQSNTLSGIGYEYDVVDLVRQCLSDHANGLLSRIAAAHASSNVSLRDARIDTFLNLILDQDKLLCTTPSFMLGTWIAAARAMSTTASAQALYERNARLLITTWGDRPQANKGGLHDYANREWGGLLRDYYYPRWLRFFDSLRGGKPTPTADDFFDMEWKWATATSIDKPYPVVPQEKSVEIAKKIYGKYFID
jgi:alpha-N-acetylglucosaminidase